jgi:uncharacterized protein YxeA
MTRKTTIFLLIGLAVVIISSLFIWGIPYTDRTLKREYEQFNNANIDGIVEAIGIKHHRTSFKLKGKEYVFRPNADKVLTDRLFEDVVRVSDRIIKTPKSDTLALIQAGKVYKYTFKY